MLLHEQSTTAYRQIHANTQTRTSTQTHPTHGYTWQTVEQWQTWTHNLTPSQFSNVPQRLSRPTFLYSNCILEARAAEIGDNGSGGCCCRGRTLLATAVCIMCMLYEYYVYILVLRVYVICSAFIRGVFYIQSVLYAVFDVVLHVLYIQCRNMISLCRASLDACSLFQCLLFYYRML